MAAGDLLIRTHSGLNTVPNAGTSLKALWDDVNQQFGSFAYSAGDFSLSAGKYLVLYAGYFNTTNTTNNERIEIQGEVHTVAGGVQGGFGQGYIRKASGDQNAVVRGSMILTLPSAQDVFIRFERTDNSTSGTVDWVYGGVVILELDDSHNFASYSRSSSQATSGTGVLTYGLDTNDEQDTGFSRAGSVVTVSNAGRYLVTYSLDINETATGREDIISYLTNSGSELTGTRGFCYLRGADGCQDGALTWVGILDLPAGAQIDLRVQCPTSATINITNGALQFWQLPSGNETAIKEATTGNYNTDGNFAWDTTPFIDTAEFTDSDSQTFTLDNGGAYLSFATLSQLERDSVQRAVPLLRLEVDGGLSEVGIADAYHRNSGGTGRISINAAGAFFAESGQTLRTNITVTAASGTLTNDSGQWSVLHLDSIFGAYTPPPIISDVDGDNQVLITSQNVVLSGVRFGAVQGTGELEIWSDTSGTIRVSQTIDIWSDTAIHFDFVQGSLTNEATVYAVVTNDSGDSSAPFSVYLGVPALDDYFTVVSATNPDHWWRFDNDGYADQVGARPFTAIVFGDGGSFSADPICEQNTHSWLLNDQPGGGRRECANSALMNAATLQTRTMAGWVRFNQIDTALSCVYEEGGGVNNVCVLIGLGGILIASYADTNDDNAQAFSDFRLEAGRDYHIAWLFDHTGENEFLLYIDGVKQSVTTGNPLTSGNLDSHTGDITMGGQGSSLEVGGTDVTFQSQLDTNYANWASWTERISDASLLELFQRGARPQDTIASDTQANMQAAVDALATARDNRSMDIRVFEPSTGIESNLALDFDGITFDPSTSIQLEWRGAGVLTVTNLNGANLDPSKCLATRGGSIVVVNPAQLTLSGLQNPTEVRVYEAGTQTEVAGQENVTSGTFTATIQTSSVDIVIAALEYQNIRLSGVDTTSDISLPIQQRFDRNYSNP